MNKLLRIFKYAVLMSLVAALACVMMACGETETVVTPDEGQASTEGLSYVSTTVDGETVAQVSAYSGTSATVNVAGQAGGKKVRALYASAFQGKTNITSISLPASVTVIPADAFKDCTALVSISAPGVEKVGAGAFANTAWFNAKPDASAVYFNGCLYDYKGSESAIASVTKLTLNTDAVSITDGLLAKLTALSDIVLPDTMKYVDGTFDNIATLKKFMATETSSVTKRIKVVDEILYSADGTTLIKFPEGKKNLGLYTIPATVKTIKPNAFMNCSLGGVTFAGVVDTIGASAFKNAASLATLSYSSSGGFKELGDGALQGTKLINFTLPKTVTSIGADMFINTQLVSINFNGATALTSIGDNAFKSLSTFKGTDRNTGALVIPDSVQTIGDNAFYNCEQLTSVNLGSGVTELGGAAFYNIKGLTSVVLSNSLEQLGGSAFYGCIGITKITLPLSLKQIGASAFKGCTAITACYYGSESASSPRESNLQSIDASAFEGCTALAAFVAPHTMQSIGSSAFKGCTALKDFYVNRSVGSGITECAQYVFDGIAGLNIVVPMDSYQDYYAAAGWSAVATAINTTVLSDNSMTVYFNTGGMGLLRELNGTVSIELSEAYCNIVIDDAVSTSTSETVDGNKRTVVTQTTTKQYILEGWYTTSAMAETDRITFTSGVYILTVTPNTYVTLYAKWSTKSTTVSTTEVYEN